MVNKRLSLLIIFLILLSIIGPVSAAPPQQGAPIPIQYGQTVENTLDDEQPTANYVFDAAGGDPITASVTPTNEDLVPLLSLTNFDGTLLATGTSTGVDNGVILTYVIPANGAYILAVTRSDSTSSGGFTLTLEQGVSAPSPTSESEVQGTPVPTLPSPPISDSPIASRLQTIRMNTTVSGTLEGDTNFNLYWFEGRVSQEISLTPDVSADYLPLLVLYGSDFIEVVRAEPGTVLTIALPANDIYFVAAAIQAPGSGGIYRFSLSEASTDSSDPEDRDGINYGDTISGTISNTTPLARYRFRGLAGDTVTIDMSAVSGDLDSYLLLADASGTTLSQDDNSGANENDAQIIFILPADGDYFILATRRGQEQGITAGNFVLSLDSDAPARGIPSGAPSLPADYEGLQQINYGDTVADNITNGEFLDIYVFFGQQGDDIEVSMIATDGALDPLLILLDDARIPLADNDDISDNDRDSFLSFELPHTGYYAVVATRFEQQEGISQGDYELALTLAGSPPIAPDTPPLERLNPTRLTAGESPSGSFDPLRFAEVYTFTAAEGTLINFAVTADAGTVATVILTDSNLNTIVASNNGILLAVTVPISGDYLVLVAPQAGPAANTAEGYIVTLNAEIGTGSSDTSPESELNAIAYGTSIRGRITEEQTEIRYIFQGRANDVVEISMTAEIEPETLDTYLFLEDSGGNILAENDDIEPGVIRDSFLSFQLPADGEYIIVATRFSGDEDLLTTGSFNLSLQYQDPVLSGVDREADPITYGQPRTAIIDEETYLIFFYFDGRQGDQITIEVRTIEGTLDSIMYLYAITSAGDFFLLTANDDSPLGNTYDPYIEYTLPRTGGYVIAVTRYIAPDADPTDGTFRITVDVQTDE